MTDTKSPIEKVTALQSKRESAKEAFHAADGKLATAIQAELGTIDPNEIMTIAGKPYAVQVSKDGLLSLKCQISERAWAHQNGLPVPPKAQRRGKPKAAPETT